MFIYEMIFNILYSKVHIWTYRNV